MGTRTGLRRVFGWAVIYALALHVSLAGYAPSAPAFQLASDDPLGVICLTGGPHAADAGVPALPDEHADACDHCILCGAVTALAAPPDAIVGSLLRVAHPALILPPADTGRVAASVTANPRLSQGPPRTA
jgi:hypothetical protein